MSMQGVSGEDREDLDRAESRAERQRSNRLLASLLRSERLPLFITALVVVVSNIAIVIGPSLIAWGIDHAIPQIVERGDWASAWLCVVAFFVVGIVSATTNAWYTLSIAKIAQRVMYRLRTRVYEHTQRLSIDFHEEYTSGRVISRQTSDLDTLNEFFTGGITQLVSGALMMAFTAIALTLQDWPSGLLLIASLLPLYFLTLWFQRASSVAYRGTRTTSARMIVHFVEAMTGIRAVKAFRTERSSLREFDERSSDYARANLKAINVFGTFDPAVVLIGNVTLAVVLGVGGWRVLHGEAPVGVMLAAVLYVRQFYSPAMDVAMFYNSYQSATSALEKISGLLEEQPDVIDPTTPITLERAHGHVEFDGVSFAYGNGRVVLPHFTLDIPAGQTVALVGSTGAGKTTLAKLLSRFYDPTEGEVRLDGVSLKRLSDARLREAVVMVTQEAYLFGGTVADNIELGRPGASLDEIKAAARAVGAHEFIESLPQGYDTDVNKRGGRVSAGQRQLISFARAFLADPAVLILDEATASLDIPSERIVQRGLQTLLSDRTAIIIAHRLSTVAIADRVLVLEHGRIVEDGTPDELTAGEGRFAALHAAWQDSLV